jgi:hypothetical protein
LLQVGNGVVTGTATVAVLWNLPYTVTVQVISPTLFANSGMTTTVTSTVRDRYGNLIPNAALNFSLSSDTLGSVTDSGSTDANGQAISVWTASVPSAPGSGLLIADAGTASGSVPITLTMDVPCTVTLQANPMSLTVGNNSVLTATITDRFGNDVANGTFVTFTTDLGNVSSPVATTNGIATSLISSTVVGTAHITATSGTAHDTAAVSFVPDVPFSMTLQAHPISQTVGLSSVLTATVYDRFSNLVANNTTVTFTLDVPGDILSPRTTTGGVATSRVTTTFASLAHITATSGAAWKTMTITFIPGAPATTTVQLGTDTLIVNSNTTTTITATVVDRYNNRVPAVQVTGSLSPTTLGTLAWQGPTNANGQASGTWTAGTMIGEGTLVVGNASVTVTLAPWRVFVPVVMKDFPPKPVGKWLRINGRDANTYQVTATLEVSATVQVDYIEWMRFSNDNIHWGDWAAFAPTTTWKLTSNNGLAMVYAQFQGHQGGISAAISDDIFLFKNGDFSQPNLADWTLDPNPLSVTASTDISVPNSLVGLLGDPAYPCDQVPLGYGSLSQSFIMPNVPTGTHLYLRFTYHIVTYDFDPILNQPEYEQYERLYDRFEVSLNNKLILRDMYPEGDPNETCDPGLPNSAVRNHVGPLPARLLVDGHPGDTMNIVFRLYNGSFNPDFNTYTYLDDVHLSFE